jgi:hypothetical protein
MSTFRFLSFGAGVQTTALLLMDSYDGVVFADTGGEMPETYAYLDSFVRPFCRDEGIKFVVVKKGGFAETLEERCLRWRQVPSFKYRNCTRDFKVLPIRRYIKRVSPELPAACVMGISFEELERMRSDHPPEYTYEYPLVERKLTRKDCEQTILRHGWPVPVKSGCFFCMYSNKARLLTLYREHPDLWKRARAMEENARRYPNLTLNVRGILMKDYENAFREQTSLLAFLPEEGGCADAGYCMT